jgi:hypothetical protein
VLGISYPESVPQPTRRLSSPSLTGTYPTTSRGLQSADGGSSGDSLEKDPAEYRGGPRSGSAWM